MRRWSNGQETQLHPRDANSGVHLAKATCLNTVHTGDRRHSLSHCVVSKKLTGATGCKGCLKKIHGAMALQLCRLFLSKEAGRFPPAAELPGAPCCPTTHRAVLLSLTSYCQLLPLACSAIIKRLIKFKAGGKKQKQTTTHTSLVTYQPPPRHINSRYHKLLLSVCIR